LPFSSLDPLGGEPRRAGFRPFGDERGRIGRRSGGEELVVFLLNDLNRFPVPRIAVRRE
jgi:hypothetical protein